MENAYVVSKAVGAKNEHRQNIGNALVPVRVNRLISSTGNKIVITLSMVTERGGAKKIFCCCRES